MTTHYDLLIIDANSLIYRTYFASSRTDLSVHGQPVGATYGFFNILLKTLQTYKFDHVAFCWDVAKETFRNAIYADYKATRESMPEDLASQIPLVRNALQIANFCQLGWKGYEADDLIGSLSRQAMQQAWEVLILTSDKDDLQLINDHISILMPKGAGIYELWDKEKLQAEYAVTGDGWLQMKALMGDSSDNIPGVRGIGIKGASSLIAKYKTIENLDAHLGELSKSLQKKIVDDHDNMLLSLQLSRIKCDLKVITDWQLLKAPSLEQAELANILYSLEFKSLINRYGLDKLATTSYNLQALRKKDLLVKEDEQAVLVWQAGLHLDFFTKEPVEEELDWSQATKIKEKSVLTISRLLRDYLVLNYPHLPSYRSEEREIICNLLENIKNEALQASPWLSLQSSLQTVFSSKNNWQILKVDKLENINTADTYFYLPYLKPHTIIDQTAAELIELEVSECVTDGLLWTIDHPENFYILDKTLLRELLVNLQKRPLDKLGLGEQTYERAIFNTWQLKDLLKALQLYDLRAEYNITFEEVSETELIRSKLKAQPNKHLISATPYLDLDLLAYSLGCLQTEIYIDFLKLYKTDQIIPGQTIGNLLINSLFYLDIAYAQVSFSHAASLAFRIEQALVPILAEMENCGILLDQAELEKAKELYKTEMDKAERQLLFVAGHPLNLNSPEQVSSFLFDELNLTSSNQEINKSGFISTRNEILQELAPNYPLVRTLLDYRKYQKMLNFAESLQNACRSSDSRVSTEYLQTKTATGRLASQNPNLQNIPVRAELERGLREAFVAESGRVLLDVDYSQIELRIMAALANDTHMLKAFAEGRDIHTEVASHIFHKPENLVSPAERSHAKAINFSLIYGATAFGTAKRLGISFSAAKEYLQNYFAKYANIRVYMDYLQDLAKKDDYVATVFSRRRYLAKINAHQTRTTYTEFSAELTQLAKNYLYDLQSVDLPSTFMREQKLSAADKRIIINTPIQGTGADIIKLAMLKTVTALRKNNCDAKLLLQVHDELLFSVKKEEVESVLPLVKDSMENLVDLGVSLQVKANIGDNWADVH